MKPTKVKTRDRHLGGFGNLLGEKWRGLAEWVDGVVGRGWDVCVGGGT